MISEQLPHVYAVVMAGGSGTRFWPLSRELSPKQVLKLTGPKSMLRETVDRLAGLIETKNIIVVTSSQQRAIIQPHISEIPEQNLLVEPSPRSTAPCIGLAAIHINRIDPDGIMAVFPSDHLIRKTAIFQRVIRRGVEIVQELDPIVTIGIPPTRPETGYGYIQFDKGENSAENGVYKVKTFAEKPNLATADRFRQAGDFYWNSGIFIWSAKRILSEMEEHLPEQYHQLLKISEACGQDSYQEVLKSHYNRCKSISIDYGIMEVSQSPIYMMTGDFEWSDVGSWDELYRIHSEKSARNVAEGETVTIDAEGNFIYSPDKMTAIIGLNNILVVNTDDATLVCPLDRAQEVKNVVEKLKKFGKEEFI